MIEIPICEKEGLTVEEAAALFNIGENKIRELINDPLCPFVLYTGKRKRIIMRRKFLEYLENANEI